MRCFTATEQQKGRATRCCKSNRNLCSHTACAAADQNHITIIDRRIKLFTRESFFDQAERLQTFRRETDFLDTVNQKFGNQHFCDFIHISQVCRKIEGFAGDFRPLVPGSFGQTGQASRKGIGHRTTVSHTETTVQSRHRSHDRSGLISSSVERWLRQLHQAESVLQGKIITAGLWSNQNQPSQVVTRDKAIKLSEIDFLSLQTLGFQLLTKCSGQLRTVITDPNQGSFCQVQ